MCILRIPRHPWCFCPDPSAVDSDGNLLCPHHISLRPEVTPSSLSSTLQSYLHSSLASIPRPGPEWDHCATYHAAHKSGYILDTGYELSCPETIAAASSASSSSSTAGSSNGGKRYKAFYPCENVLCADCSLSLSSHHHHHHHQQANNKPGKRGKKEVIALHLTPLRERFEIDSALDGRRVRYRWYHDGEQGRFFGGFGFEGSSSSPKRDEAWEELVTCGLATLDDQPLDEAVERRILSRPSAADDWGLYVDVVEGFDRMTGRWGLDADASAVYLLPGMGYDAETLAKKLENVEEEKKKIMMVKGEGWLAVGGVMNAMGKFL